MSIEGGAPAGYNPNTTGNMPNSAMGQMQMRPFFWLPNLDYKHLCTPSEMVQFKADKKIVPGVEAMKFLPVLSDTSHPCFFLLKDIIEAIKSGFGLQDWAHDLTPEQIAAIMEARAHGIEGGVDTSWISMQASLRNVAMNDVGGPDLG